jgi:hypothetical protein
MKWKLYSEEEYNNAAYKDLLAVKCVGCNRNTHRTKISILESLKYNLSKDIYCSRICRSASQKGKKSLKACCNNCGKNIMIYERLYNSSKTKKFYCSKSCAAKYNNKNKTYGLRRSKLEFWLETNLSKIYPYMVIEYNKKDAIGSELDIFIPKLKLAFELNGIYHYEPIHGPALLEKIKNNDVNKFQECNKRGIGLCVIDTTAMCNFKEKKAEFFLEIITNIINKQLEREGFEPSEEINPRSFSKAQP